MKAFISCISIALVISSHAKDEEWYDANGKLVRVLPATETVQEWKPRWQMETEDDSALFRWSTRRSYVRPARVYRPNARYYSYDFGRSSGYSFRPYRYHSFCKPGYGLRGYYSNSGNWGIRIGN